MIEMQQHESLLLRIYGNSPQMRMLDYFLEFPKNEFSQKEIIEELGMSKTTFYKYFDFLLEQDIIKQSGKDGKTKLYTINLQNPIVQTVKHGVSHASERIASKQMKRRIVTIIKRNRQQFQNLQEHMQALRKEMKLTKTIMAEIKIKRPKKVTA